MLRFTLPLDENAVRAKSEFFNHYGEFVYTAATAGFVSWQNTDARPLLLTFASTRFNIVGACKPLMAWLTVRAEGDTQGNNNRMLDMRNPTWAGAALVADGTDMFCSYTGGLLFVPPRWYVEGAGTADVAGSHRLNLTIQGWYVPKGLFA